jgi:hypothetical protein
LVSITACQPLALICDSSGVMYWPPALFTSPSITAMRGHDGCHRLLDRIFLADVAHMKTGQCRRPA